MYRVALCWNMASSGISSVTPDNRQHTNHYQDYLCQGGSRKATSEQQTKHMRGSERLCCESFKDDGSKVDLKAGQSDEDEHDRQVRP